MKNKFLKLFFLPIVVIGILVPKLTNAIVPPNIQWQQAYGGNGAEGAQAIQQTTDGGYIVVGYTTTNNNADVPATNGSLDFWVVKLKPDHTIDWSKTFGGSGLDIATSVQETSDGYIVAGYTASTDGIASNGAGGTLNHGGYDMLILKLDNSGNLDWKRVMGGTGGDFALSVKQSQPDGGYVVAGRTESNDGDIGGNNHGWVDYWVVKLKPDGSNEWAKTFGDTGADAAFSVQQTSDGGFIVAGESNSTGGYITSNHGGYDFWVVKIDNLGNMQWQQAYGGASEDNAYSIIETAPGEYIVAGRTSSNNTGEVTNFKGGTWDYWVVKLKSDHTIEWQKTLGGSNDEMAYSINKTSDGGYVVGVASSSNDGDVTGGHGMYDYWIVKLKPNGDIYWQKAIGGSAADVGTSVQQTTDGGYVIAGLSGSNDGDASGSGYHSNDDFWVVKLLDDPPLSVNWLSVNAILKGNNLQVNWATATETNNDHFEIEASTNGTDFTKIGNIKSKAENGNSEIELKYSFEKNSADIAFAISLLALGLVLPVKRKYRWIFTAIIISGLLLFNSSCTKNNDQVVSNKDDLFIRIAQVDKDGAKTYSQVVKAVRD